MVKLKGMAKGNNYFLHPAAKLKNFFNNKFSSPRDLIINFVKEGTINSLNAFNIPADIDKIVCKRADLSSLKIKNTDLALRIKNNIIIGSEQFFYYHFITAEYLNELIKAVLGEDRYELIRNDPSSFFTSVKELNTTFYREWIKTKKIFDKIELKLPCKDIKLSEEEAEIEFEELKHLPDRGIRKLLDELTKNNVKAKWIIFALYNGSDELKERFFCNLSRNRISEIKEGFEIWEPGTEDIIKAQELMVQTIIRLSRDKQITLSPELRKKLFILIRKLDKGTLLEAQKFLKSGKFIDTIQNINQVTLQLLIRNVPRRTLIAAFHYLNDEVKQIVRENMTETGMIILNEDLDYRERSVEYEEEGIIQGAEAQKIVMDKAKKIEKKLKTEIF